MADDGLQFDKAEFEAPPGALPSAEGGPACAFCRRPLTASYWAVADQVSCGDCRERWQEVLTGGSGALRFARASVFGLIAAGLGAALYFGAAELMNAEWALVAIAVGLMVGWAVRQGADRRGGWQYQALAVSLTYLAIVTAYVPNIARVFEWSTQHSADEAATLTREKLREVEPRPEFYLFAIPVALRAPFLGDGGDLLMNLLIIGVGLYEAWRMNKRLVVPISGPHAVGPPAPPTPPHATADAPAPTA